jgi:predicted lactoylglutathione lyase
MPTKIFVNLAVEDLDRSRDFYESLGYSCADQFTDENAACLVISDDIYAMLQTKAFFSTLTNKEIIDSHTGAEVLLALGVESRERVDELADRALTVGGSPAGEPMDLGFMYRRGFQDPDGHQLEALYMDLSAAPPHPDPAAHTA